MFAFRFCGGGSISTSGGSDFSASCDKKSDSNKLTYMLPIAFDL